MDLGRFNDISQLSNYISSYGVLAPAIAYILFVVQAIFPVFPYVILAAAGGLLFGFKLGFALSWAGALTGACIAFWGCRLVGSDWVIKKFQAHFDFDISGMDPKLAFWTIIIARIIPVVPTPLINAAAALSGVAFWNFFFSSAIGKIPTALLYTGLGHSIFKIKDVKLSLSLLGIAIILVVAGRYVKQHKILRTNRKSRG
ncbi:MAG: TVP38/TMEM64 family protein [Syntrophomonas sp.]